MDRLFLHLGVCIWIWAGTHSATWQVETKGWEHYNGTCNKCGFQAIKLRIVEQAAGHLRWEVYYPPSQHVGSGFEPHWRPQPAKMPAFGGYNLQRRKTRSFPVFLHANVFFQASIQLLVSNSKFADLFHDLPLAHKITVYRTGAFYFSQACSEDVFNFSRRQTNYSYRFISELMDVSCMAGVHQQPEQSNYLAEGQTKTYKLCKSHTQLPCGL